MSLVTRCPACSTAFKVVRDQLRISEGWVRCGRCSQVFDATLDLHDSQEGEPNAPAAPAPDPAAGAFPAASELSSPASSEFASPAPPEHVGTAPSLDEDDFVEPDDLPPPATPEPPWPAPDLLDLGPVESRAYPSGGLQDGELAGSPSSNSPAASIVAAPARAWSPLPTGLPAIVADEPWPSSAASRTLQDDAASGEGTSPSPVDQAVDAQLQKALRRSRIQALRESRAHARAAVAAGTQVLPAASAAVDADGVEVAAGPVADTPASIHEAAALRQASEEPPAPEAMAPAPALPSFLDAGPPAQPPTKSPRRAALLTLAVLAGLLLMLQVLRHERDALAATHPGMRPVLAALCQLSACELSPMRRLDAIRIDGSSFTPEREGGGYRLLFSLRNASAAALAMPAIELSLLDGNERPVIRRVFRPAEFGAPDVLGPRAEQSAALALALKPVEGGGVAPVVGYSLLAFYP